MLNTVCINHRLKRLVLLVSTRLWNLPAVSTEEGQHQAKIAQCSAEV